MSNSQNFKVEFKPDKVDSSIIDLYIWVDSLFVSNGDLSPIIRMWMMTERDEYGKLYFNRNEPFNTKTFPLFVGYFIPQVTNLHPYKAGLPVNNSFKYDKATLTYRMEANQDREELAAIDRTYYNATSYYNFRPSESLNSAFNVVVRGRSEHKSATQAFILEVLYAAKDEVYSLDHTYKSEEDYGLIINTYNNMVIPLLILNQRINNLPLD